ncbi:MAG: O-antigen ligase family protein [Bacteriovoracia bacterium]
MNAPKRPTLDWIVAIILALGILPSFTAGTRALAELSPVFGIAGPLNAVKLGIPILLYYAWTRRKEMPKHARTLGIAAVLIGSASTLVAAIPCEMPTAFLRDWAATLFGGLAGFCLCLLPKRPASFVLYAIAALVLGSAALDLVSPSAVDWLLQNFFDPKTNAQYVSESKHRLLGGIFGKQSLAKLLAWVPALVALAWVRTRAVRTFPPGPASAILALSFACISLSLATTQRGPFVAGIAGLAIAIVHYLRHHRVPSLSRKRLWAAFAGGLAICVAAAFLILPTDILSVRLKSLLWLNQGVEPSSLGYTADGNRDMRIRATLFSLDKIRQNPLGDACIPWNDFNVYALEFSHAHSLILEQLRSRGWIWGILHLLLWVLAWLRAWRDPTLEATLILAAVTTTWVLGLFDHPWWVINQAMVLSFILFSGLACGKPTPEPRNQS